MIVVTHTSCPIPHALGARLSLIALSMLHCIVATAPAIAQSKEKEIVITDIASQISCSEDLAKTLEVRSAGQEHLIQLPELISSPVINSQLVCDIFLQRWAAQAKVDKQHPLRISVAQHQSIKELSLTEQLLRPTSLEPLQSCRDLGLCRASILDIPKLDREIISCGGGISLSEIISEAMPRTERPELHPIDNIMVDFFPHRPFSEIVIENGRLNSQGHTPLLASTMTIGHGSFKQMNEILGAGQRPIFLLYDAGLSLIASQSGIATDQLSDPSALLPVPITTGNGFARVHHWKAVVTPGSQQSILTGMNISSPAKTLYLDLTYSFDDPLVAAELQFYVTEAIALQCKNQGDFACLTKLTIPGLPRQTRLNQQLATSCERFELESQNLQVSAPSKRHFLQPQLDDLEQTAIDLINSAHSSVVLTSHKLTLSQIVRALAAAKQRGVRIFVVTAYRPNLHISPLPDFIYYPGRFRVRAVIPPPHMKTLIIDNKTMLFGTGNFSDGGLRMARELFAVTNNHQAITTALQIIDTYRRLAGQDLPLISPQAQSASPPIDTMALILPNKDLNGVPTRANLPVTIANSIEPKDWWLTNYREVLPSLRGQLARCGLGSAPLLTEDEFIQCMQSEPQPIK